MIQLNLVSNIFSFFSTGLIFFMLAMVISGWWISNEVIQVIQEEAEINVYYHENTSKKDVEELIRRINEIEGVREGRVVSEEEVYHRMVEILGKEAEVLEYFDDNPFSSFIEVKIDLEEMQSIMEKLQRMTEIEHIRDNREVLERIQSIGSTLKILGYLVVTAVGISTLVIISHIIRQGIYNNREQINTLRLLGAPEFFIAFPFLLEGLLLTLAGGILAAFLATLALKQIYIQITGPLPFIPLPSQKAIITPLITLVISMSGLLGVLGSLFGLSSSKSN